MGTAAGGDGSGDGTDDGAGDGAGVGTGDGGGEESNDVRAVSYTEDDDECMSPGLTRQLAPVAFGPTTGKDRHVACVIEVSDAGQVDCFERVMPVWQHCRRQQAGYAEPSQSWK